MLCLGKYVQSENKVCKLHNVMLLDRLLYIHFTMCTGQSFQWNWFHIKFSLTEWLIHNDIYDITCIEVSLAV